MQCDSVGIVIARYMPTLEVPW